MKQPIEILEHQLKIYQDFLVNYAEKIVENSHVFTKVVLQYFGKRKPICFSFGMNFSFFEKEMSNVCMLASK